METLGTISLFRIISLKASKKSGLVFFRKANKAFREERLGVVRGSREEEHKDNGNRNGKSTLDCGTLVRYIIRTNKTT